MPYNHVHSVQVETSQRSARIVNLASEINPVSSSNASLHHKKSRRDISLPSAADWSESLLKLNSRPSYVAKHLTKNAIAEAYLAEGLLAKHLAYYSNV